MTLEELEARVQRLEDIEAIKKLHRAYNYYVEHWQDEELIALFSEADDTSIEVGELGLYTGKEGVRKFFVFSNHFLSETGTPPPEFLHILMSLDAIVDVYPDGKTAKGGWYGFGRRRALRHRRYRFNHKCKYKSSQFMGNMGAERLVS